MMRLLILGLMLSVAACGADPINQEAIHTGNSGVTVHVIAVVDGMNVYRLQDGGAETVYFVAPSHGSLQTAWTTCVGKNCTPILHTVQTLR